MKTDLLQKVDIQKISSEGAQIYEEIKPRFEHDQKGKFVAIDIDSKDTFVGDTSVDAVQQARAQYPDKVFYVVKIGHSAAETLASLATAS